MGRIRTYRYQYCQTCGKYIESGEVLRRKLMKTIPDCTDICSMNIHTIHKILEMVGK